jgi:hypothetical protein
MSIQELHLFDFDGTIFKSPSEPEGHGARGWWEDPRSLLPPCVPERPGAQWYHAATVAGFHAAAANPEAVTVVCTGRLNLFRPRLTFLLANVGIRPDELFLQSSGDVTEKYKLLHMRYLLKQLPYVKKVEFWEDRQAQLQSYQAAAERWGYAFVPHLVRGQSHPATCRLDASESRSSRVARRWLARQVVSSTTSET